MWFLYPCTILLKRKKSLDQQLVNDCSNQSPERTLTSRTINLNLNRGSSRESYESLTNSGTKRLTVVVHRTWGSSRIPIYPFLLFHFLLRICVGTELSGRTETRQSHPEWCSRENSFPRRRDFRIKLTLTKTDKLTLQTDKLRSLSPLNTFRCVTPVPTPSSWAVGPGSKGTWAMYWNLFGWKGKETTYPPEPLERPVTTDTLRL